MLSCADIKTNFTTLFWHRTRGMNPFCIDWATAKSHMLHKIRCLQRIHKIQPHKALSPKTYKLDCETIGRGNFAFIWNDSYCPGYICAIKLLTKTINKKKWLGRIVFPPQSRLAMMTRKKNDSELKRIFFYVLSISSFAIVIRK